MIKESRVYVLIILAFTGFSLAALAPSKYYILFFIILLVINLIKIKSFKIKNYAKEYKKAFFMISPFIGLLLLQFLSFKGIPPILLVDQVGKLILYFLISFLILKEIKNEFHVAFVDVMYFLAIISLFFYPTQFFPDLQELIAGSIGSVIKPLGYSSGDVPDTYISKTLVFFTYHHNYGHPVVGIPRNCGAFWEPGVFGFFLVIALVFNLFINGKSLFTKENLVFIFVGITTFSTTSVLAISLTIFYYYTFALKISIFKKIIISSTMFLLFFFGIWQQDFVGGKIYEKIEDADSNMGSRFGAVLYHFQLVKDNLSTGVGLKYTNDLKNSEFNYLNSASNGISVLLMFWGLFGMIFFFFILYNGVRKWILNINGKDINHYNYIFFIIIFISFSQALTIKIFFFFLLTLFVVYNNPAKKIEIEG